MKLCRLMLLSSAFNNKYPWKHPPFYSTRPLPTLRIPLTKPDYRLHQIYLYPKLSIWGYPIFPWPNICILSAPFCYCLFNHQVLRNRTFSLGHQLFDKYFTAFSPSRQLSQCKWMYITACFIGEAIILKPGTCSPHHK